jgi:hypothetical protein
MLCALASLCAALGFFGVFSDARDPDQTEYEYIAIEEYYDLNRRHG